MFISIYSIAASIESKTGIESVKKTYSRAFTTSSQGLTRTKMPSFELVALNASENKLEYILNQEQEWADEANRQREAIARRQKIMKIIAIVFIILTNIAGIFVAIILVKKNKKYKNKRC